LGLVAGRSAPFYCVPSPHAVLILGAYLKRQQCGFGRGFTTFVKSKSANAWINMASWYSSSDESASRVIPDPDESFELRLAEVEKEKVNYGICISQVPKRVWRILIKFWMPWDFYMGNG
jgi:hypothetical protein